MSSDLQRSAGVSGSVQYKKDTFTFGGYDGFRVSTSNNAMYQDSELSVSSKVKLVDTGGGGGGNTYSFGTPDWTTPTKSGSEILFKHIVPPVGNNTVVGVEGGGGPVVSYDDGSTWADLPVNNQTTYDSYAHGPTHGVYDSGSGYTFLFIVDNYPDQEPIGTTAKFSDATSLTFLDPALQNYDGITATMLYGPAVGKGKLVIASMDFTGSGRTFIQISDDLGESFTFHEQNGYIYAGVTFHSSSDKFYALRTYGPDATLDTELLSSSDGITWSNEHSIPAVPNGSSVPYFVHCVQHETDTIVFTYSIEDNSGMVKTVVRSTDGGDTWAHETIPLSTVSNVHRDFTYIPSEGILYSKDNDGGDDVLLSDDFGATFTASNAWSQLDNLPITLPYAFHFVPESNRVIATGKDLVGDSYRKMRHHDLEVTSPSAGPNMLMEHIKNRNPPSQKVEFHTDEANTGKFTFKKEGKLTWETPDKGELSMIANGNGCDWPTATKNTSGKGVSISMHSGEGPTIADSGDYILRAGNVNGINDLLLGDGGDILVKAGSKGGKVEIFADNELRIKSGDPMKFLTNNSSETYDFTFPKNTFADEEGMEFVVDEQANPGSSSYQLSVKLSPINLIGSWVYLGGGKRKDLTRRIASGEFGNEHEDHAPEAREGAGMAFKGSEFFLFGGVKNEPQKKFKYNLWSFNVGTGYWKPIVDTIAGYHVEGDNKGNFHANNYLNGRQFHMFSPLSISTNPYAVSYGGERYNSQGELVKCNDMWLYNFTTEEWAWYAGDLDSFNQGVTIVSSSADSGNHPGARSHVGYAPFTASTSALYFGGEMANGVLRADLWQTTFAAYPPQSLLVAGPNQDNPTPVFGPKGVRSTSLWPGGRKQAFSYTGFVFGGEGIDKNGDVGLLNDMWSANVQGFQFLGGGQVRNQNGRYGDLGIADHSNVPGSRRGGTMAFYRDHGNGVFEMLIFGGFGYGENSSDPGHMNDIWIFHTGTETWRWIGGAKEPENALADHGREGVPSVHNTPGGRESYAAFQEDGTYSELYVFGGRGKDVNAEVGKLSDVFKFTRDNTDTLDGAPADPTGQLVSNPYDIDKVAGGTSVNESGVFAGSTLHSHSFSYHPGARKSHMGVAVAQSVAYDEVGYCVFGGEGYDDNGDRGLLNDAWRMDEDTGWQWSFGEKTINASNSSDTPGARAGHSFIGTNLSSLFMFGGWGIDDNGFAGFLNDMWQFDCSYNTGDRTHLTGSLTRNQSTTSSQPGGRVGACFNDGSKALIMGGYGLDANGDIGFLDDLWLFDKSAHTFTLNSDPAIINQSRSNSSPGGRRFAFGVRGFPNKQYTKHRFFGGYGFDEDGDLGYLMDHYVYGVDGGGDLQLVASVRYGKANVRGVYGTFDTFHDDNHPGGRISATHFYAADGLQGIMGGYGVDEDGNIGYLSDIWLYDDSQLLSNNKLRFKWVGGSKKVNFPRDITAGNEELGAFGGHASFGQVPYLWNDITVFGGFGGESVSSSVFNQFSAVWRNLLDIRSMAVFSEPVSTSYTPPSAPTPTSLDVIGQWTYLGSGKERNLPNRIITHSPTSEHADHAPEARNGAVMAYNDDKLYLFGGVESTVENKFYYSLWRYNLTTGHWSPADRRQSGYNVEGSQGQFDFYNYPAGRRFHLFMPVTVEGTEMAVSYGGELYDSNGQLVKANDMWLYNFGSFTWAWSLGDLDTFDQGVTVVSSSLDAGNYPGARSHMGFEVGDHSSSMITYFGGEMDNGALRADVWRTDFSQSPYRSQLWIGPNSDNPTPVYGPIGETDAAYYPGGRKECFFVNNYVFGGEGIDGDGNTGLLNDLWSTDGTGFQFHGGSEVRNQNGFYGELGKATSYTIPGARKGGKFMYYRDVGSGDYELLLFGGYGYGELSSTPGNMNDLWVYHTGYGMWRWIGGAKEPENADANY